MENITLGQIALGLTFFVGLIGSFEFILSRVKKMMNNLIEPLNKKIDDFQKESQERNRNMELSVIKTNLVNFFSIAEKEKQTKEQTINAHELYDRYKLLGGNSYVHSKWEKLIKEGKI